MRFEIEWREDDMASRRMDGEASWFILMERTMSGLKEYDVLSVYEGESPSEVARKHGGKVVRRSRTHGPLDDMAGRLRDVAVVMES